MTRSLSRWQAMVLGLVVLLGGAGAVSGLFAVGGRYWPWQNVFYVNVEFPKVRGVEPGTKVRVLGIDAGEVEKVQWVPAEKGARVRLTLRLNSQVNDTDVRSLIRSNASAQIVDEGMVGGKIIELNPGDADNVVADNGTIEGKLGGSLTDTFSQVGSTVDGLSPAIKLALDEIAGAAKELKGTAESVKRKTDAASKLPFIGDSLKDPTEILVRPNCELNPYVLPERQLFEPGRAVLTTVGKQELDKLAPLIIRFTQKGTEVVIVTYADPKSTTTPDDITDLVTRQQSEAVLEYLKGTHKVDGPRLWGWWWSDRKVISLGMGTRQAPVANGTGLPPARTEVLVFVPQH